MDAKAALRTALLAHAPLVALVAQRIYPDAIDETAPLPAGVLTVTSTEPIRTLDGLRHGAWVTLSLQFWAATRTAADACSEAAQDAIAAAGEDVVDVADAADLETGNYATVLTVRMLT